MKRANLLIGLVLLFAVGFYAATQLTQKPKVQTDEAVRVPMEKLLTDYSPVLGPADAKVTIVEFLDPECEACAAFYPKVKGLIDDNKTNVRLVVRYMLFHGNSQLAAIATEAAGKQGKYWEMQGQLFYRASEWTHQKEPQQAAFEKFAKDINLNIEKFRTDMKDPKILANILNDFAVGPTIGVRGTPTLFVNGEMLSEMSYDGLKSLIQKKLAE